MALTGSAGRHRRAPGHGSIEQVKERGSDVDGVLAAIRIREQLGELVAGADAIEDGAVFGDEGETGAVDRVAQLGEDVTGQIAQNAGIEQRDQAPEQIFHIDECLVDLRRRIEDMLVETQDVERADGDGGVVEAEEIIRGAEPARGKFLQIDQRDVAGDVVLGEFHHDVQIREPEALCGIGGENHVLGAIGPPEHLRDPLAAMKDVAKGRTGFRLTHHLKLKTPEPHAPPPSQSKPVSGS